MSAPAETGDAHRARLVTWPFVSLAAAALAFYIAGGILLPITPRVPGRPATAPAR